MAVSAETERSKWQKSTYLPKHTVQQLDTSQNDVKYTMWGGAHEIVPCVG